MTPEQVAQRREAIRSIGVEHYAVVLTHADARRRADVEPGQQVVVADCGVVGFESDDDGYVGLQPGIEANAPPRRAGGRLLASNDHDGDRDLAVHKQKVGLPVDLDMTADSPDVGDGGCYDFGMQQAELAIGLDIAVVALGGCSRLAD